MHFRMHIILFALDNIQKLGIVLILNSRIAYIVVSVLYCSIYHCTSFEKNEIEKFGILIFDDLFIRDLRIIPEGENMSIQCK